MIERREDKNKDLENDLRKEEKNEARKNLGKKIFKFASIIILVIILLFMYMHYIGTSGLVVKEYKITSSNLPSELHGLKIVHFSDLNYLSTVGKNKVEKLIEKINEIKPDIVVFTGDLIAEGKELTDDDVNYLIEQLNKIEATIGLYAIKGDKDYNNSYYDKIIYETNFKIINNTYELIYYKGNTPILLTGSGSILNDDCDLGQTFSYNEMDNLYTISLIHEPDIADTINNRYKPDLILAGHNLNGQIRMPLIGGLIKADEGKKYVNSRYNLSNSTLFVSGGIGTNEKEFRLFNHPSINFYRLVKEAN